MGLEKYVVDLIYTNVSQPRGVIEKLTVRWRCGVSRPGLRVALLPLLQAPAGRRHPLRLVHHKLRIFFLTFTTVKITEHVCR